MENIVEDFGDRTYIAGFKNIFFIKPVCFKKLADRFYVL